MSTALISGPGQSVLASFNSFCAQFAARPHWGKVCPIDAQIAERLYPRIGEFRDACDAIDANGSFRNQWLQSVVFGKSPDEAAMPASPSSTTNQSNL